MKYDKVAAVIVSAIIGIGVIILFGSALVAAVAGLNWAVENVAIVRWLFIVVIGILGLFGFLISTMIVYGDYVKPKFESFKEKNEGDS